MLGEWIDSYAIASTSLVGNDFYHTHPLSRAS